MNTIPSGQHGSVTPASIAQGPMVSWIASHDESISQHSFSPRPRTIWPGFSGAILISLAVCSNVFGTFVYETSTEFQSAGDFDGDGRTDLVIVDKASGSYRLAYQLTADSISWAEVRAGGVQGVTGFAIGRLNSPDRDALAFTAPEANQLMILDASEHFQSGLPNSVFVSGIGPSSVAAIDIGGPGNTAHDDLVVETLYNPNVYQELLRNDGTSRTPISSVPRPLGSSTRPNTIQLKEAQPSQLAFFVRGPGGERFELYNFASGQPQSTAVLTWTNLANREYVAGLFNRTSLLHHVLIYQPGGSYFVSCPVKEPTVGVFSLNVGASFDLGSPIRQIITLPGVDETRLLVFFGSGNLARIYRFDGSRAPARLFEMKQSAVFTGAVGWGNGRIALFTDSQGIGTSTDFEIWKPDGTNYVRAANGQLPRSTSLSGSGNVLLFRYEPFVSPNPGLVSRLKARDWSSRISLSNGVTALAEIYGGVSQGVGNATPISLGATPASAHFGLANQLSDAISIFSLRPASGDQVAQVSISPNPGKYKAAIQVSIIPSDPNLRIYYRRSLQDGWTSSTGPFTPFALATDATVQYYAELPVGAGTSSPLYNLPTGGSRKSAIQSARYTFELAPGLLDSDHDGVPDFVEIAKGLDPVKSGRDADNDKRSDLEEILAGTNPLVKEPDNTQSLDLRAVFDLAVNLTARDGVLHTNARCAVGTGLSANRLSGGQLSTAWTANLGLPGLADPAARLTNVFLETSDRLLVIATDQHFDLQTTGTDKRLGRELLALLPIPGVPPVNVAFTYGGGTINQETNAWIQAARLAYSDRHRILVQEEVTILDTLTAVLFEEKLAQILRLRGVELATNLSLFPCRPHDVGRFNPPQSLLLSVEKQLSASLPGYRLQTMHRYISNQVQNSASSDIVNLRKVAADVYDVCSAYNNSNPATFALPVDELRFFIQYAAFDSNYVMRSTTAGLWKSAWQGASNILATVSPRPVTNLIARTVSSIAGQPADRFVVSETGTPLLLFQEDGLPCSLPDAFGLVPNISFEVFGYSDLLAIFPTNAIEVISITMPVIPVPADPDTDGNRLVDSWERAFFGDIRQNPALDSDGDGYTNLQELTEHTDPNDPLDHPSLAAYVILTLRTNPPNGGSINVAPGPGAVGQYNRGTTVKLTAVPASGFRFASWTGGLISTSNPANFTISNSQVVTANFVSTTLRRALNLTSNPQGAGAIFAIPQPDADGKYTDGTTVTLTATPSFGYVFSGWTGASGAVPKTTVVMDGEKNLTANFTRDPAFLPGLQRQIYTNLTGSSLADLTNSTKFPSAPDVTDSVSAFESQYRPNNAADNYGQRLTGYLIPPTTGAYLFYLASDDAGRVYLSTDENPANKRLIVEETGWSPPRNWQGTAANPQRVSASITLTAGKFYYVEGWHKEGVGGDNFALAWKLPTGAAPISGSAPIGQPYLAYRGRIPIITSQPDNQVAAIGASMQFQVQAEGANLRYQWQFNEQNLAVRAGITGVSTNVLRLDNLTMSQAGRYRVIVNNNYGAVTSRVATLTLVQSPRITGQPQSVTAPLNSLVRLQVAATGTAPLFYQWYFNSRVLTGATNPVLSFERVQKAHEGSYYVEVGNVAGFVTSAAVTVTVTGASVRNGFDLDGDGKAELFVQHTNGTMAVWYLNGTLLKKGAYFNPPGTGGSGDLVAVGDFNGDAKLDLLIEKPNFDLGIWFMDGTNRIGVGYLNPTNITAQWKVVATGDFNLDNNRDLLYQHDDGRLSVWLMRNTIMQKALYLNPAKVSDPAWRVQGAGDFNGDGSWDLVLQNQSSGVLVIWFMSGLNLTSGQYVSPANTGTPIARVVAVGDYDADGLADIVLQRGGQLEIWFMNGAQRKSVGVLNANLNQAPGWKAVAPR
jgi:uncharacterized repeat protein (TIGR02543 family)